MNYCGPEGIKAEIKNTQHKIVHIMTTKSKRGLRGQTGWLERMEKALPLSSRYVAEIEHIRNTCGYDEARQAQADAREELKSVVAAIMDTEPRNMGGVVIQSQTLATWQAMGVCESTDLMAFRWPGRLAQAILKQAA
jgi:hypothetical protein